MMVYEDNNDCDREVRAVNSKGDLFDIRRLPSGLGDFRGFVQGIATIGRSGRMRSTDQAT